jgi:hypothetical protein
MPEASETKRTRYLATKHHVKPTEFRNHLALAMLAPARHWKLKLLATKLQAYKGSVLVAVAHVRDEDTWRYE